MPGLSVRRFNWVVGPWQQSQAWRERQAELHASFSAASDAANTKLYGATINQTTGQGAIVARIASDRRQAQAVQQALSKLV